MRLPSVEKDEFCLLNAEQRHAANPESFPIPPSAVRQGLQAGAYAKLLVSIRFDAEDGSTFDEVERMWAVVRAREGETYLGWLTNVPHLVEETPEEYLVQWCELPFRAEHVIDVQPPDPGALAEHAPARPSRVWPR